MTINLSIDIVPDTLNQYTRFHWAKQRALPGKYANHIVAYNPGKLSMAPRNKKATVSFTLYRKRLMDEDAATGSLKPIIDALVRLGFLFDDSPLWMTLNKPVQLKGEPRTDIEIVYD